MWLLVSIVVVAFLFAVGTVMSKISKMGKTQSDNAPMYDVFR